MHRDELQQHFYRLTPTEIERKNSPTPISSKFYRYLKTVGRMNEDGVFHLPDSSFQMPNVKSDGTVWYRLDTSPHQSIFRLKKASRFSREPLAYADFIAIRYVYSGESQITTPTTSFTLHANDLCLLNGGFVFSQYLPHEEDVVFTMMFEKEYLISNVLHNLKGNGVVTQFIIDYIMENKNSQNYIIFHGENNERIPTILEDMLCEYMDPTLYGDTLVESYLQILLIEMIHCNYEYSQAPSGRTNSRLAEILDYIDHHYNEVSLELLSEEFGYNSKYLSRLIKNYTGKNFKDFIMEKRMEEIVLLLGNTDLSIHRIMEQCGLSNETYFYKRFRALYGISPNEYRKTIRRSGKEHNK